MTRIIDFLVELLERIGLLFGIGRRKPDPTDPFAPKKRSLMRRLVSALPVLLILFCIGYLGILTWRTTTYPGMDLAYPQTILPPPGSRGEVAGPAPATTAADAPVEVNDESTAAGSSETLTCAPSRVVQMQIGLIDLMVNQNDWIPGAPQYNLGFFGLVDFEDTPWFDNKASFQIGMLSMVRRVSLDLADTLGRVRGTSTADADLQAAQSRLRTNERAWVLNNPFDAQLQTVMEAASTSYRGAIPLYRRYNERLAACDALFDVRRDNLRTLVDRLAADLGSMASQLAQRANATQWSVQRKEFIPADGNNRGWFDFRADNLFHQARGQLFALHGLMQAVKMDFGKSIEQSDLGQVWDRMEAHLAEGAELNPMVVSNGREDGAISPDHLSVMGQKVLRARANMVELRDILNR
ncbi:MAG: hypothetical protein CML46_01385 [Rhodobacteraceae bacterium]|nr:hypothetical protein [Paracoccaceae bacterium]MBR25595.1 hypothetical protein [Paracoccaceae bacterium]